MGNIAGYISLALGILTYLPTVRALDPYFLGFVVHGSKIIGLGKRIYMSSFPWPKDLDPRLMDHVPEPLGYTHRYTCQRHFVTGNLGLLAFSLVMGLKKFHGYGSVPAILALDPRHFLCSRVHGSLGQGSRAMEMGPGPWKWVQGHGNGSRDMERVKFGSRVKEMGQV